MANQYLKNCSAPLAFREMGIRRQRFYLYKIRMAVLMKTNVTRAGEDEGGGKSLFTAGVDLCSHCGN